MKKEKFTLSNHFGSFYKTGNVYDIKFERFFNCHVDKLWQALTNPTQLAIWFGPAEIDLKVGGKVSIQLMMAKVEGVITRMTQGELLEYTFGEENVVCWELFKEGDERCRLIFTERLVPPSHLQFVAPGWHGYLDLLHLAIEGEITERPTFSMDEWKEITVEINRGYQVMIGQLDQ